MTTMTTTPAPAQATVTYDGGGLIHVQVATPFWNLIDTTMTLDELTSLYRAIAGYFLTHAAPGSEFGVN